MDKNVKNGTLKAIACLSLCLMMFVAGCNQSTTAALVDVLGNATSSVAALEGDSSLATKLTNDTGVAVNQIKNWKTGTPAQVVIAALQLVESDLNLFPQTSKYQPLIDLAITTVVSILEIVQPSTASAHTLVLAPHNKSQFKKSWNALVAANPNLSAAKIK